jgi:DNA-binding NarL/FixJ family response regulator
LGGYAKTPIFGALSAGAVGYLLKGAPATEIMRAIRDVAAGGSALRLVVAAGRGML